MKMALKITLDFFTVHGEAKYPLWEKVDQNVFDGLSRGGNPIKKNF